MPKNEREYAPWTAVVGPIQWLFVNETKNGQTVRRAVIRDINDPAEYVRCTIWPDYADVELEEGDWIFVEGPGEIYEDQDKEGNPRETRTVNVQRLATLTIAEKKGRKVQNQRSSGDTRSKRAW